MGARNSVVVQWEIKIFISQQNPVYTTLRSKMFFAKEQNSLLKPTLFSVSYKPKKYAVHIIL